MRKNNGPEGNSAMNSNDTHKNEESEIRTLTQEEINEQIKSFIAPFTRQLKNLTLPFPKIIGHTASEPGSKFWLKFFYNNGGSAEKIANRR